MKFNNGGSILQLGQSGSLSEVLGQLKVDQELFVPNTSDVKAILKSIGGGHTLTDWNGGIAAITTGGTVITHGIKDATGANATPNVVLMQNASNTQATIAVTSNGTTTFTAIPSTNINAWWFALLF